MLCISCPNRNAALGFFSRRGVWLRLFTDGGWLLHWRSLRRFRWLDGWGRFAPANRDRLTLRRDRGYIGNGWLRWSGGSRFGWIDGFDGWVLGELRLFFHKGLLRLFLRCGGQIVRRYDRWPLTNSLSLTAHGCRRFFARCPCARLLYMTDIERFCWRGFGLYLIADLRCVRLFTDRRWCALRHIVRKPDFHLLCMKMIPRRHFFCAGFLCLPHIRASPLFLRRGCRYALRLFWFWSGAQIICVLTRCAFCRRYGRCWALRF